MPVWRLNSSGSCVELLKHQLFIGRDDDCDLTIKHKGIDIRHAVLNHDQRLGVFRLTDLGSSYGTFVNGESVGEESVPLYVGTRIMFGKNPNIWCVEVGEAAVKPYIPEPSPQQHAPQLQPAYHSVPPSLSSHSDLYSSPSAPSPLFSHSFQTQPPGGRSSPAYTPGSCAGKSYFGDPGDNSPFLRGNESFAPVGQSISSQISFSDRIVSTPLSTNSYSRSADSRPDTERFRNPSEDASSTAKESVRDFPTRARTLYGQPSWWGDGSDTFSTPPSHRKYTKPDDIATPNTSTEVVPSSRIPESRHLPTDILERRSPIPDPSEVARFSEQRQSADSRDFRSSTKFFVSMESGEATDPPASLPPEQPLERENSPLERPPLIRRGSYEIPSEQLDISLSRPVIDPEPPVSTPPRGRKSEVFVVELGERSGSKKLSRTEPRLLFKEDRDIATERLAERDTVSHKVRLAFRETEPILSTPQPPSNHITETELDTDPELEFMTPCTRPQLESPQVDSLVSSRGEEIGDPVTSSTPISMTSSESQLMSPPAPILLPPPFRLETEERGATPECTQKKGRRRAWNIPQQSLDPAVIQTLSDVTRSIEFNLDQANSQASLVRGVLVKHLRSGITPLSAPDSFEDISHSPEFETASEEIVEVVRSLKRIEAKVKSYSKHHGANMGALQDLLNKLRVAESSDFDTPEVPTHDQGVRKGSFEGETDSIAEQLKHFSDLSYTHNASMPWFKLPEFVKKRACRYLLQHYLGHFFKEKLSIDQLTLDISNGIGTITQVELDTHALNESLENVNAPVEILEGFVGSLSVSIPWKNLFRDNCKLDISGLNITVAPRHGFQTSNTLSMTESLISSSLTLSLKVAKQCMQQESESASTFEGMEACAQTIESILNRVEVSVSDVRFQVKYFPPDRPIACIVLLKIRKIEYFDEAFYMDSEGSLSAEQNQAQNEPTNGDTPASSHVYIPPIFSIKHLKLSGVTLEVGQGPHSKTVPTHDPRGFNDSSANIVRNDMYRCSLEQGTPSIGAQVDPLPCELLYPIASLNGQMEIRLKLNLTDHLPDPKLKVECTAGSLHFLLSPDIVHMLAEITSGLMEELDEKRLSNIPPTGRPINPQDYLKIAPQVTNHIQVQKCAEVLYSLNAVHSPRQDTESYLESRDDEDPAYYSICSTLEDDLRPLDIPPAMSVTRSENIAIPCLGDPSSQLNSLASSGTPPSSLLSHLNGISSSPLTPNSNFSTSPNYTPTHLPRTHKPSTAPIADSNKFVIKIGGISLALLHVSITSLYQLSDSQLDELREYAQEENERVEELASHTQLAMLYFHRLGRLADQSDLQHITGTFLIDNLSKVAYAIPNDHLRLHISGLNAEVQISAYQTDVSVSMNGVNLSECLFDCPSGSDVTLGPLDALKTRDTSEYALSNTQILKFHISPERLDPCLSVRFNLSQEKRKVDNLSHQKSPYLSITDVQVSTIPFTLVLDVTLLSRIHSLLQPDMQASTYNQWTNSINYKSVFQSFHQSVSTQRQALFQTAVNESNIPIETQISLRFKSPSIAIICRIPSLEKKDSQEAGLWWKPSLRQESFLISTTNVRASFQDSSLHKQDRTFNLSTDSLTVSLKESSTCLPVKFLLLDCLSGGQQKYPSVTFRMKEEPSSLLLGDSVSLQVPLDSAPTISNISDSAYVQAAEQFASPFSSKKYIHNQEELVLPGSQLEMEEFEAKAGHNSLLRLELSLPVVKIHIPNKEILQAVINRLTELVSWHSFPQSQAPSEYLDIKKLSPLTPLNQIYSAQNSGERSSRLEDDSDEDQSSYNSSATTFHNQPPTFSRTSGLNSLSLSLGIDSLLITAITRVPADHSEDNSPILDSGPTTLVADKSLQDEPVGECMLQVSFLRYFHVSGFRGDDTLKYDSLYTKRAQLSHKGILSEEPYSCVDTPNRAISPDTLPVLLYCSDHLGSLSPGLYHPKQGQFDRPPCISLAIKTKHDANNQSKSVTMSLLLKGLAMKHTFVPSDLHCFSQLSDLFSLGGGEHDSDTTELQRDDSLSLKSIRDKPKNSFPVLFTFYFHLRDCGIDYRPLYLPLKTFVTIGSFCFSSNIVSGAPTSMQRMLLEDIALYLSKKTFKGSPNLKEDYFCAMDFGLLELTLRLASEGISKIPQVDLSVSSETLHVWTCADAVISIRDLLLYITSNGDFAAPVQTHQGYTTQKPPPSQSLHQEGSSLPIHEPLSSLTHSISGQLIDAIEDTVLDLDEEDRTQSGTPKARGRGRNLKKTDLNETLQVLHTEDGMEISFSKSSPSQKHRSHSAFSPKISNPTPLSMSMSGDFSPHQLSSMVEEDGFTLLEDPMTSQTRPEVKCYLDPNEKIRVVENHFTIPDITTSDQLQPPSHYPCPTQRYSMKDLAIVWHLYAGTDFEENSNESREKYSSKNPVSIPTHPPTVRFTELPSSIGKDDGLTQLSIVRRPTDTDTAFTPLHAPIPSNSTAHKHWRALGGPGRDPHNLMIIKFSKVRVQHEVYPESAEQASRFVLLVNEIEVLDKLKSSSINKFLHVFTSESMPRPTHANMLTIKGLLTRLDHPDDKEASIKVSLLPMKLNIDQDALLMIKDFFTEILETKPISFPAPPVLPTSSLTPSSLPSIPPIGPQAPEAKPIYIRSFVFYPDVPIRVDYQAKHRLHMDQGTIAGLLLSLTDLNCSEIKLKKLNSKKGFLGYDKLLEYVIHEWLMDIKSYQLPRIIGGVGPMYYITQLAQGTVDLVRLPWQQYRQDGRIFWGMQQGATSFSSSTAMATLELANRVVVTIQSVAETIYELISPNYITYRESNLQPERPHDLREGITHACNAVSSGVSDTATNFYRTAANEKEFGYTRAVTGVIKQIPGSVIMPVIIMTKATSSMLGGAKNQLMPDARRETELKYKNNKQNQ